MKLTPIKFNPAPYQNNYKDKQNNFDVRDVKINTSFGGTYNKMSNIKMNVASISDSQKFKSEMETARKKSLEDKASFDDFIVTSMNIYNKTETTFPIKEDFFEYKIKARFTGVVKKVLNHEIKEGSLNEYLKQNYYWGFFTDKKYGGPESFATAIPCVMPYIKGYEVELEMSKLKDLKTRENALRKEIDRQDKIIDAKEQLNSEYIKPVQAAQKNLNLRLPNSIMLKCKDENIADEIIQWTFSNALVRPIAIGCNCDDTNSTTKNKLKSALENAAQTYENYQIPTLIYCENFDKLLKSTNPPSEIAAIKALLTNTYEKYHATIIFTAANPQEIDNVLKQPHRMKQVKIN